MKENQQIDNLAYIMSLLPASIQKKLRQPPAVHKPVDCPFFEGDKAAGLPPTRDNGWAEYVHNNPADPTLWLNAAPSHRYPDHCFVFRRDNVRATNIRNNQAD